MTDEPRPDQMMFWDRLDTTDPQFTSTSEYGAKLTSINGVYQFRKMTELFGPCGVGWGYEVTMERFDNTGPLYARRMSSNGRDAELVYAEGTGLPIVVGEGSLHTLMIKLWYRPLSQPAPVIAPNADNPDVDNFKPGTWVQGKTGEIIDRFEIEGIGHTPFRFYQSAKHLVVTVDEEYYKKSLTDALTNAMAKLGMSADVRMGMFDDAHYRAALADEMAILHAEDKDAEAARQRHEFEDWFQEHCQLIETSKQLRELEIIYKGGRPRVERQGTPEQKQAHFELKNKTVRAINAKLKGDAEPEQPELAGDKDE